MTLGRLTRFRQLFVACVVIITSGIFATTILLQTQLKWSNPEPGLVPPNHILNHPYFNYSLEVSEPTDDVTQSCRLPRVHPFHPSTWKHFPTSKPIVCKVRQPSLTYVDRQGYLRFNVSELVQSGYGPPEHPSVDCSFRPILRPREDDFKVEYGAKVPLPPSGILLEHDFILVGCVSRRLLGLVKAEVYSNFHVNTRPLGVKKGATTQLKAQPINVVILGVDSLSRLAFTRFLPRTYRYITEQMKAHIFRGMNKVADNTFPNLAAILTGDKAYGGDLPLPPAIEHYDSWPLVWKPFAKVGYSTLFDEDYPDFNMFTYLSTGFKYQPTDYYMRPFWLAAKESSILRYSSHLCLGSLTRHKYQINRLLSYLRRQNGTWKVPGFAFSFMAEVTHEYLSRAAATDVDFENFLRTLVEERLLGDNTFFVFMSDHGHRFDAIRGTPVGRLEERMPFFAIVPPKSLPALSLNNLATNTARLVSPFDHHATLLDIISHVTNGTSLGSTVTRYGRSLFAKVPINRTCDEAGIPEFYCVCGTEVDAPLSLNEKESSRLAASAGGAVVERVNWLLRQNQVVQSKCATLKLKDVRSVQKLTNEKKLTVIVEAGPSGAVLEATVEMIGANFKVTSDVSRINEYKGQSECVTDPILRKYCYCKWT